MKYLLSVVLALAIVLSFSAAALAVPVAGAGEGQFVIFGDYDWSAFNIGAGYGLTDSFTLGGMYDITYDAFGGFATLAADPILIQGEAWATIGYGFAWGRVIGLYNIDLDPLTLGLGGGYDSYEGLTLSAAANLAAGDNLSLYGEFDYCPQVPDYNFKLGMELGF